MPQLQVADSTWFYHVTKIALKTCWMVRPLHLQLQQDRSSRISRARSWIMDCEGLKVSKSISIAAACTITSLSGGTQHLQVKSNFKNNLSICRLRATLSLSISDSASQRSLHNAITQCVSWFRTAFFPTACESWVAECQVSQKQR